MSQYTFVVNPSAGKGAGAALLDKLRSELRRRGIEHDLITTTGPGHATAAARECTSPLVVAMGGDGTINEVVNGLRAGSATLGVLPAGSGNDFIKSVNIPSKFTSALDVLLAGKRRTIDIGTVRCGGESNSLPRLFVNGVGVGFDAAVAARTREIGFLTGTPLYILAVLQTLGRYTPPTFTLVADGAPRRSTNLLIAIGNGRCAGGGFYLTPDAVVDDGLLDVCMVEDKTVFQILRLMPKVMRGNHHDVPGVSFARCKALQLSSRQSFYVHADGEIVGENVQSVAIGLKPASLTIVAGATDPGTP